MKLLCTVLFTLCTLTGIAQSDSVSAPVKTGATYRQHATTITLAVGFIDDYRHSYSLPAGFLKNNTSGFAPLNLKIEYGLGKHISLAATFGYDAFVYNFKQEYTGNNGPFTRYRANKTRIFSGGLAAFYHLDKYIHINRLDPFIGIGLSLNNIRYSAYPQGDSTVTMIDHTVTPYIKVGARYYISDRFSLFGDLGYDKQNFLSIGFSCRFFSKKDQTTK